MGMSNSGVQERPSPPLPTDASRLAYARSLLLAEDEAPAACVHDVRADGHHCSYEGDPHRLAGGGGPGVQAEARHPVPMRGPGGPLPVRSQGAAQQVRNLPPSPPSIPLFPLLKIDLADTPKLRSPEQPLEAPACDVACPFIRFHQRLPSSLALVTLRGTSRNWGAM